MSVGIVCDECGQACADFSLPTQFKNHDGSVVEISVLKGPKSLDLCRRCFCSALTSFAAVIAPEGVNVEWREGEQLPVKPEVTKE